MNNRPRNYTKTSNPDFWENFYWGNGGLASEEIIENRNKFYQAFICKLKKAKNTTLLEKNHHNKQTNNEFRDHTEYYEMGGSSRRVIVYHPYYISNETLDLIKQNGFREIKPMYASNARSFMKIVSDCCKSGIVVEDTNLINLSSLLI